MAGNANEFENEFADVYELMHAPTDLTEVRLNRDKYHQIYTCVDSHSGRYAMAAVPHLQSPSSLETSDSHKTKALPFIFIRSRTAVKKSRG